MDSKQEELKPCPLMRLADHLSARPQKFDPDDIRGVADWLDYSLNRCGLVVVEEHTLTRTTPTGLREALTEARAALDDAAGFICTGGVHVKVMFAQRGRIGELLAKIDATLASMEERS